MERKVRTLFISDVHLGCRYAQPHHLLSFLRGIRPEKIYILGDFIDGWKLRASFRWPAINNQILRHLFGMIEQGTQVLYTPGNHDQFLRMDEVRGVLQVADLNVQIADEFVFEAVDGRKFLVTHGDEFDVFETRAQWLSLASSYIYDPMLSLDWYFSRWRGDPRRSPYARCASIKGGVKRFIRFVSDFQRQLLEHARRQGCRGVICGHIHTPDLFHQDEMIYCNTGDWVEHCTALVEYHDGAMRLESHYIHGNNAILPISRAMELPAAPGTAEGMPHEIPCGHFPAVGRDTRYSA